MILFLRTLLTVQKLLQLHMFYNVACHCENLETTRYMFTNRMVTKYTGILCDHKKEWRMENLYLLT